MALSRAEITARHEDRRRARDPEAFRAWQRDIHARFRGRHPEKKAAWNAVYRALRNGTLVRPSGCERCQKACTPDASHDDYTKRLEVEWLCRACHAAKDTQQRRA